MPSITTSKISKKKKRYARGIQVTTLGRISNFSFVRTEAPSLKSQVLLKTPYEDILAQSFMIPFKNTYFVKGHFSICVKAEGVEGSWLFGYN